MFLRSRQRLSVRVQIIARSFPASAATEAAPALAATPTVQRTEATSGYPAPPSQRLPHPP